MPHMASHRAMTPLTRLVVAGPARAGCALPYRRFLSSTSKSFPSPLTRAYTKPLAARSTFQLAFKRSYADAIPPKPKRRIRTFFRWTWRLTYVTALGGLGYLAYIIYQLRTPSEQFAPDPSKKTLVILGKGKPLIFQTSAIDHSQAPVGAQSLSLRNSIQANTTSLSSLLAISSSLLRYFHHALPARLSTVPSWNQFATFSAIKKPP